MIANHCPEPRISHEELEHFPALRTLCYQISDANHTIVLTETDAFKHFHQLVVTTVKVSNYNRSSHTCPVTPTYKCKSCSLFAPTGRYRCSRGRCRVSLHLTCSC